MKLVLLAWTREVLRAPFQSILSVIGVSLGIAAFVAVNVANHSARESFISASTTLEEAATHIITGNVSDDLYRTLRLAFSHPIQPIVRGRVRVVGAHGEAATILGIDPIANYRFNTHAGAQSLASIDVNGLFADAFSAYATADTLQRLGSEGRSSIEVRYGRKSFELHVTGFIETDTPLQEQSLRDVILTDIAAAQTILGMRGKLSSIQMQLSDLDETLETVETMMPEGVILDGRVSRHESIASITSAFQTNLTAMSLLALLVAIFLVYNTMTFLVMRREPTIELLRAIGVTRRETVTGLVLETLLIGIVASVIGLLFGVQLSEFLLSMVERSINNLYFPINADISFVSRETIAAALGIGIVATLLAAVPALYAARVIQPSFGEKRRNFDNPRSRRTQALIASVCFIAAGILTLQFNPRDVIFGFVGIYFLIAAYMCLIPVLCKLLGITARTTAKRMFGIHGVLASRALTLSGGRTSIAICALCIAISATIGVGIMISSFRTAVDGWVTDRLRADVYISARGYGSKLSEKEINSLQSLPDVEYVGVANWTSLEGPLGQTQVFAVDYSEHVFAGYRFKEQVPEIWKQFQNEGVIVSEPYSWKNGVSTGDVLEFWKADTTVSLPVLGVYYDYSSDRGVISIHRDVYVSLFHDQAINSAALFFKPGTNLDVAQSVIASAVSLDDADIWNARGLRDSTMDIFDQTFAITAVLRTLAVIVAIIAVISVLAMVQIDRERELRVQNAIGFTPSQLWASATAESGMMGLFAGILSIPSGLLLSWLLIWVVNQRSFGWTMQIQFDVSVLTDAVFLSTASALVAGLIPALILSKRSSTPLLQAK